MPHETDSIEVAKRILSSENPWQYLKETKIDGGVLSTDVVQLAVANAYIETVEKRDSYYEALFTIMSIPALATSPQVHNAFWEVLEYYGEWSLLDAYADRASQEILEHPAVHRFIKKLVTDAYFPLTMLSILSTNSKFVEMKDIIDTVLSSKENMVREICEAESLSNTIEPLKKYPELLFDRRVIDAFIEAIPCDYVTDLLLTIPELSEHQRIKAAIDGEVSSYDFRWMKERFEIEWLLCRRHSPFEDVTSGREYLEQVISDKGWEFAGSALVSELSTCSYLAKESEITNTEVREARAFLFELLSMPELAGYDGNLKDLLLSVNGDDFEVITVALYERTVEMLEVQIQKNGPTLFLDIDRMASTYASNLVPLVVKRRKEEIEKTVVHIYNECCADLRHLWCTEYGFNVLSSLKLWRMVSLDDLERVKAEIAKLGFDLNVAGAPDEKGAIGVGPIVSDEIRQRVMSFADRTADVAGMHKGLQLLGECKHPEAISIAGALIGKPSELEFTWELTHRGVGWTRAGKRIPVYSAIETIGTIGGPQGRKALLELLNAFWNFDDTNSSRSMTYAVIVKALEQNHDRSVVRSLILLLQRICKFVEEDGAPPKHAASEMDTLLQSTINILLIYKPKEMFMPLLKIYDRILLLEYSDWEFNSAYRARETVLDGIKRLPLDYEETKELMKRLLFMGHLNEDIAEILVGLGNKATKALLPLATGGTPEQAKAAKAVLDRLSVPQRTNRDAR